MILDKEEIRKAKNILISLKRAKFDDFRCEEALAFADCFAWFSKEIAANEKPVESNPIEQKPVVVVPPVEKKGKNGRP